MKINKEKNKKRRNNIIFIIFTNEYECNNLYFIVLHSSTKFQ